MASPAAGSFDFYCPTRVLAGAGALENIPFEMGRLNAARPLVLTADRPEREKLAGVLKRALGGSGMTFGFFGGVTDNPDSGLVNELAHYHRTKGYDAIVALGSGTVVDVAKVLALTLSGNEGDGTGALTRSGKRMQAYPLLVIPDLDGSGYESTARAALGTRQYTAGRLMPQVVVLDQRTIVAFDCHRIASSALIAITQSIEACICPQRNPLTDAYAWGAIELINRHLFRVLKSTRDGNARLGLANGLHFAGCAYASVPRGMIHDLGRVLSRFSGCLPGFPMLAVMPSALYHYEQNAAYHVLRLLLPGVGPQAPGAISEEQEMARLIGSVHLFIDGLRDVIRDVPCRLGDIFPNGMVGTEVLDEALATDVPGFDKTLLHQVLADAWDGKKG